MKTAIEPMEPCQGSAICSDAHKLRVVIADGSPNYMAVVCTLLDFHKTVDVVGRAADFKEAIKLAVTLEPDLVLMDLEMPSANMAISIINLCSDQDGTRIVGMSDEESIRLDLILAVSAIVPKPNLRQEFLPILNALYDLPGAKSGLCLESRLDRNLARRWNETSFRRTVN
ncbi:MAG TPA: response regulator [Terriglobales bacterium]|nr:response regulator [Terriglobales bacterium]